MYKPVLCEESVDELGRDLSATTKARRLKRGVLIYLVTCLVTGASYIGVSMYPLRNRWLRHLSMARNPKNSGHQTPIARAIRKHGEEAFALEELAYALSWEDAAELEPLLIQDRGTATAFGGYNVAGGGLLTRGGPMTRERRERVSRAKKGMIFAPEHRAKVNESRRQNLASRHEVMRQGQIKRWGNEPVARSDAMRELVRNLWDDPEKRARMVEVRREQAKRHPPTPEHRAKVGAGVRAYWARRRAEANGLSA